MLVLFVGDVAHSETIKSDVALGFSMNLESDYSWAKDETLNTVDKTFGTNSSLISEQVHDIHGIATIHGDFGIDLFGWY